MNTIKINTKTKLSELIKTYPLLVPVENRHSVTG